MELTRVVMLEQHDSLFKGEQYNLPHELAKKLVDAKKASPVKEAAPSETKPAAPPETKVNLAKMKKAELIEYAQKNFGLQLGEDNKVPELIEAIEKAAKEAAQNAKT